MTISKSKISVICLFDDTRSVSIVYLLLKIRIKAPTGQTSSCFSSRTLWCQSNSGCILLIIKTTRKFGKSSNTTSSSVNLASKQSTFAFSARIEDKDVRFFGIILTSVNNLSLRVNCKCNACNFALLDGYNELTTTTRGKCHLRGARIPCTRVCDGN